MLRDLLTLLTEAMSRVSMTEGLADTVYMVSASSFIALAAGLPLGVVLSVTAEGGILRNKPLNSVLSCAVNIGRSVPFVILMIALIPITRKIVGTSIGVSAAIVPLSAAAVPFIGRVVESSLREVDPGVIEAAQSMGATPFEIIRKVLLPEGLPGIIAGFTLTVINLVGYSAMAGIIGGGGLGVIAVRYGYQRFMPDVMAVTVVILVVMVQLVQIAGDKLASLARHDRKN
ncbi:MAG: ABC transporter permease [Synergistaceae bacterium]|jgi:D-methionine transport system permease protein|nr:ABC transporter permease [Synergistaceae bacterium]